MKMQLRVFFTLCAGMITWLATAQDPGIHIPIRTAFIENKGQWDPAILFRADLPGGVVFLEHGMLTYAFQDQEAVNKLLSYKHLPVNEKKLSKQPDTRIDCQAYQVRFDGANKEATAEGRYLYTDYNNYYIGNDPKHWTSRVRKFQDVYVHDLYKGVDLEIAQRDGYLKYNYYLRPGADPSKIVLDYTGLEKIRLKNGELQLLTMVNKIVEMRPFAYQVADVGGKKEIP
jgi:hypothetical protein